MDINDESKADTEIETYVIEISVYPQSFTIVGKTRGEAILEAQRRFYEATNGMSIWETTVVE